MYYITIKPYTHHSDKLIQVEEGTILLPTKSGFVKLNRSSEEPVLHFNSKLVKSSPDFFEEVEPEQMIRLFQEILFSNQRSSDIKKQTASTASTASPKMSCWREIKPISSSNSCPCQSDENISCSSQNCRSPRRS